MNKNQYCKDCNKFIEQQDIIQHYSDEHNKWGELIE